MYLCDLNNIISLLGLRGGCPNLSLFRWYVWRLTKLTKSRARNERWHRMSWRRKHYPWSRRWWIRRGQKPEYEIGGHTVKNFSKTGPIISKAGSNSFSGLSVSTLVDTIAMENPFLQTLCMEETSIIKMSIFKSFCVPFFLLIYLCGMIT